MSDYIPLDIQVQIMHKLPVKSLLRFRQVCSEWKNTIDSTSFVDNYTTRVSESCSFILSFKEDNTNRMYTVNNALHFNILATPYTAAVLKPIACSEGIWCFAVGADLQFAFVVWNPSIDKSITVFANNIEGVPSVCKVVYAFGVRPDTLDAVILKIHMPIYGIGTWRVVVFTLTSNSWTTLSADHLPPNNIKIKKTGQAVAFGKIYWVGSERWRCTNGNRHTRYVLVSFDLTSFRFQIEPIPLEITSLVQPPFSIGVQGDSLLISAVIVFEDMRNVFAWRLNVVGGFVHRIQLEMFLQMPLEHVPRFIGYVDNGGPVFDVNVGPMGFPHVLYVWNQLVHEFVNPEGIQGNRGSFILGAYKESLVLQDRPHHQVIH